MRYDLHVGTKIKGRKQNIRVIHITISIITEKDQDFISLIHSNSTSLTGTVRMTIFILSLFCK